MATYILYGLTIALLIISFAKNRQKTKKALKKALKSLSNILPQFFGVLLLVGFVLAFLDTNTISRLIGSSSGWIGVAAASLIGAVTLIPGFVAFPTSALLLAGGAGYMQIGAFISSLMMVGIVTIPVEIKFFGKKFTLLRNVIAFVFSFLVAFVIGKVMGEI